MDERIIELTASMAANDKEHESFRRRLSANESEIKHLSDLTLAVQETATAVKSLTEVVADVKERVGVMDDRIQTIEHEPADKLKKLVTEIVKAAIIAAVGALVGFYIK